MPSGESWMHRHTMHVPDRVRLPEHVPVSWIGPPPSDEETRTVWESLTEEPVIDHAALVERVGERLFRRDLDTVGGLADIGFLRPFYVAHARRLVAALDGTRLRVGKSA